MLALLALLYRPNCLLQGKYVTFHIDIGNAFEAVVKNNAKPTIIVAMTHLIWHRIRHLDITAWFEWVPGTRNIADLPTRRVDLPFPTNVETDFGDLVPLSRVLKNAKEALEAGRPIVVPLLL